MKKITLELLIIIAFLLQSGVAIAITPTSSPSGTLIPTSTSAVDKQIQNFKDKIANKVAEMQKKDQKAIAGTIQSISTETISFKTPDEKTIEGKISEATTTFYQISTQGNKEIKQSDLKKGDYIIANGLINGDSITANYIYVDKRYFVNSGKIIEINKQDYFVKVLSSEKDNFTLDIETYTKVKMLNIKSLEIEKSGFSKLKEGDSIHFIYKKTGEEKEQNRFSAQTILVIPQEFFTSN